MTTQILHTKPKFRKIKKGRGFRVIVVNSDDFPYQKFNIEVEKEFKRALKKADEKSMRQTEALFKDWLASEEAPQRISLNDVLTDQITRIGEFTDITKIEFGALLLKDMHGVKLDFIQIGESRNVEIRPTRDLRPDEFICGSMHNHPLTDRFSLADIKSFLSNDWEKIMVLRGAHKIILIAIKTANTRKIDSMDESDTKLDNKELAEKYGFLLYVGTSPDNLELRNTNVEIKQKTTDIENIVKQISGTKDISFEVKKIR